MLRVLSLMAFALLLVTPVAADDKIDAKLLIGKWEMSGAGLPPAAKATVEFTKDNKIAFSLDFEGQQQKFEGTYKVDGSKMEMTLKGPDGQERTQKLTITKLTDKEATIKHDEKGDEAKFKKIS
jgi:uncharacterized protein (TIGR03066 family)